MISDDFKQSLVTNLCDSDGANHRLGNWTEETDYYANEQPFINDYEEIKKTCTYTHVFECGVYVTGCIYCKIIL
jgi:hypothetical protein